METFALKWDDFQSNIVSSFKKLRNKSEFHDVTLVSNDHKQVSAHKVVLSASSMFFRRILETSKHTHPMLCLDGINAAELEYILDFIYFGEVEMYHEEINKFLDISERLKLDGLIGSNTYGTNREAKASNDILKEDNDVKDKIPNENKLIIDNTTKILSRNEKSMVDSGNFSSIEELDLYIKQQIITKNDKKQCGLCFYTPKRSSHLKEHIETHVKGLSLPCGFCNNSYPNRGALRYHMRMCVSK